MSERAKAISRLIVTAVLLVNGLLTAKGLNPIPFDESQFTETLSQVMTAGSVLWVWWKNNNITSESAIAQGVLRHLKNDVEGDIETLDENGLETYEDFEEGDTEDE